MPSNFLFGGIRLFAAIGPGFGLLHVSQPLPLFRGSPRRGKGLEQFTPQSFGQLP